MTLDFMTPDIWNGIVIGVILIGSAFAALRLYSDFTRSMNPSKEPPEQTHYD